MRSVRNALIKALVSSNKPPPIWLEDFHRALNEYYLSQDSEKKLSPRQRA